jgi:murein DD-endopeptidase MepM/ murein hydrolase activator NlpD
VGASGSTTSDAGRPQRPAAGPKTTGSDAALPGDIAETVAQLRNRHLDIPVTGVERKDLRDTYTDARGGGARTHEALDIMAPRNTPVRAVEDGPVAKLFNSDAGGITLYQFDPTGALTYYYAHLERYAEGVREGQMLRRGDVLGYVGTTGNADADAPHLHFAIFRLTAERQWWKGVPVNPYLIFR